MALIDFYIAQAGRVDWRSLGQEATKMLSDIRTSMLNRQQRTEKGDCLQGQGPEVLSAESQLLAVLVRRLVEREMGILERLYKVQMDIVQLKVGVFVD